MAMRIPAGMECPRYIELLETLNVFGIHADYMAQFKQFLEDEGLPPGRDAEEIVLPMLRNLGTHKLKVIWLKPEINGVQTAFALASSPPIQLILHTPRRGCVLVAGRYRAGYT